MYQTIVFEKKTGKIIKILKNQYIRTQTQLARLLGLPSIHNLSYIYFPHDIDINPDDYYVKAPAPNTPYQLFSKDDTLLTLKIVQEKARKLINHSSIIDIVFEGGTGDYMLQADVVYQLTQKHPEKGFNLYVDPSRIPILRLILNTENITFFPTSQKPKETNSYIRFADITQLGYYNPPYGKVATYCYIAGINPDVPISTIRIPPHLEEQAQNIISSLYPDNNTPRIALHRQSGEPNPKTWPWQQSWLFMTELYKKYNIPTLLIGGYGEQIAECEYILNGLGIWEWDLLAAILSQFHAIIAIDSAIMHIAHRLHIPVITLWGPTTPDYILPNILHRNIIQGTCPKIGCMQYACNSNQCMLSITPEQVLKELEKIINLNNHHNET
ncbi:MAG: hypothetical protein DRJ03_15095 [Chloroflexi bacterium]|nr:MAG: hypothetical protein DRJ03_15095 [Chloroflexota bacterium]